MRARRRLGALVLPGCVAACASPATPPRETGALWTAVVRRLGD